MNLMEKSNSRKKLKKKRNKINLKFKIKNLKIYKRRLKEMPLQIKVHHLSLHQINRLKQKKNQPKSYKRLNPKQ